MEDNQELHDLKAKVNKIEYTEIKQYFNKAMY